MGPGKKWNLFGDELIESNYELCFHEFSNQVTHFWAVKKKHIFLLVAKRRIWPISVFSQLWAAKTKIITDIGGKLGKNRIRRFEVRSYESSSLAAFLRRPQKIGVVNHLIWRLLSTCQIKWVITPNFCGLLRKAELYGWYDIIPELDGWTGSFSWTGIGSSTFSVFKGTSFSVLTGTNFSVLIGNTFSLLTGITFSVSKDTTFSFWDGTTASVLTGTIFSASIGSSVDSGFSENQNQNHCIFLLYHH